MTTPARLRPWTLGVLIIALLWLGLLLGVAFLATPVKFSAPSLTLPVALDVGRHTFSAFNKVEWVLSAALLLALLGGARTRLGCVLAVALIALVVAETLWLLPALDQRVGLIIAGQQPPASALHEIYIALELVKLAALVLVAAIMSRRLLQPE